MGERTLPPVRRHHCAGQGVDPADAIPDPEQSAPPDGTLIAHLRRHLALHTAKVAEAALTAAAGQTIALPAQDTADLAVSLRWQRPSTRRAIFGRRWYDRVGLWKFSTGPHAIVQCAARRRAKKPLAKHDLRIEGGATRDKPVQHIAAAVGDIRNHYDNGAINAVIVLTDGYDTVDNTERRHLRDTISSKDKPVEVCTIAYGADAEPKIPGNKHNILTEISKATGDTSRSASDADPSPMYSSN